MKTIFFGAALAISFLGCNANLLLGTDTGNPFQVPGTQDTGTPAQPSPEYACAAEDQNCPEMFRPMTTAIARMIYYSCRKLKSCQEFPLTDCLVSAKDTADFHTEFNLSENFSSAESIRQAETSRAILFSYSDYGQCLNAITNTDCLDLEITSVFNPDDLADFSRLPNLFRLSPSCSQTFKVQ